MSKERYIWLDGEKIPVNEDVYRAYYRPVWRESKRKETQADNEYSYEQMLENGYDLQADDDLLDDIIADKLLLDELYVALAELTDDERSLIDALYFKEKSERDIAAESGTPQTTINYRKKRILEWLRKKIKNF